MNVLKKIFLFYYTGFKEMPRWGKCLWLIILVKIFVFFVVVKSLFFPNFLKTNFDSDKERSEYVINKIIKNDE